MIQRDYYLRMIEEFARALANFLEKPYTDSRRDREMADLYRQYVGDYTTLRNLSTEETLHYGNSQWDEAGRTERLAMLAELLYTEATYRQAPLCLMLYDKAYRLYDYVETYGNTYSIDRRGKMAHIRQILDNKG